MFGLTDTNHFDQTDFRREDLESAPCESNGLDGRHTSQSYPITGIASIVRIVVHTLLRKIIVPGYVWRSDKRLAAHAHGQWFDRARGRQVIYPSGVGKWVPEESERMKH
ncbi:hypothetical protein Y032_0059g2967 [Ancylostoma ceylanicum]|nr:hypothetical protein Y032_0059g2967 [Ancylostoma ceylanicum]